MTFGKTLDVVVFFSPSGVKYALKELLCGKEVRHLVAIGPTTYGALVKALPEGGGVSLHQAESPSPEGVRLVLDSIMNSVKEN